MPFRFATQMSADDLALAAREDEAPGPWLGGPLP